MSDGAGIMSGDMNATFDVAWRQVAKTAAGSPRRRVLENIDTIVYVIALSAVLSAAPAVCSALAACARTTHLSPHVIGRE